MKKILSFALVLVMVLSLPLPAFAAKSFASDTGVDVVSAATTNGNSKNVKAEKDLPKGLQDKAVVPYGHRKDEEVTVLEMEAFIQDVKDYIDNLDPDSDDDGIDDSDDVSNEEAEDVAIIDLAEAERIALGGRTASIVEMYFNGEDYKFILWYSGKAFEVKVDGVTGETEANSKDHDFDLTDIMSYEDAKTAALEYIDIDAVDGTFTKVKLDLEDVDENDDEDDDADEAEDPQGVYEIKIKTEDMVYEIEINALNGDILEADSDENDDEDDDENDDEDENWDRDKDRDKDKDKDGNDNESMVPAIYNLIDRIEYEISIGNTDLNRYMFQLEQKFNTLKKIYGEAPEKEDYTNDLEELIVDLELIKDDSVFDEENQNGRNYHTKIQTLINEMQDALEALDEEGYITEAVYKDFKDEADVYLDMIDETVENEDVKALVTEIRGFALENDFGSDLGEYSQDEVMDLLMLAFKYSSIADEDLEDYYKDLKLAYRKFKMSKLVAGDYLETLTGYKTDLDALADEDLTETEVTLRDELIKLITRIENAGKMPLGIYYDIEQDALTLIEVDEEEPTNYEEALDELINDVRVAIFASYGDIEGLRVERMTLLAHYFTAVNDKKNADTESEFKAAVTKLETALKNFNDFIDSETSN